MKSKKTIQIHTKESLTLEDARALMPVVFKITKKAFETIEELSHRLDTKESDSKRRQHLQEKADLAINEWKRKVAKLGGIARGLWYVDFDAGDGYFSWQYPEPTILFWHSYEESSNGRISVNERTLQPDVQKKIFSLMKTIHSKDEFYDHSFDKGTSENANPHRSNEPHSR